MTLDRSWPFEKKADEGDNEAAEALKRMEESQMFTISDEEDGVD